MSKTTNKFPPEVRERAVRLVLVNQDQYESRWQSILSISLKIGCAPQTLNDWVKKVEVDTGQRGGITTEVAEKMKALVQQSPPAGTNRKYPASNGIATDENHQSGHLRYAFKDQGWNADRLLVVGAKW